MSHSLLLRALAVLAMLFVLVADLSAAVDITNVQATVSTSPPAKPDEPIVSITYDITDVPTDGVIVRMKVELTDGDGTKVKLEPMVGEFVGDEGNIMTSGRKTITWQAYKTLLRSDNLGSFDAQIIMIVEGTGDPTMATLHVRKYTPSGWDYFATGFAIMKDLQRVPAFQSTCPARGNNWHEEVTAGAKWYTGNVTQLPAYRGRNPSDAKGAVDQLGCSFFLATKNLGTPEEVVWANFAKVFVGVHPTTGVHQEFEFQFRFYYSRADNTMVLRVGNAGKDGQTTLWSELNVGEDFDITIAKGDAEEEKSATFKLELKRREYKLKVGGTEVMIFKAIGESWFKKSGTKFKLVDGEEATINEALIFNGSFLELDTSYVNSQNGYGSLSLLGDLKVSEGTTISGGAQLWEARADLTASPLREILGSVMPKLAGYDLYTTKIAFVGGMAATGVTADVVVKINSMSVGCAEEAKTNPSKFDKYKSWFGSPVGLSLGGVAITSSGIEVASATLENFGLKALPDFCVTELKHTYDKTAELWTLDVKAKFPFINSMGGGFGLDKGKLNAVRFNAEWEKDILVPIEPPIFTWKGIDVELSGLAAGPVDFKGTGKFSHIKDWMNFIPKAGTLGRYFPSIFEIEAGVHITWPSVWEMNGGYKIFGVPGLGLWLGTGSGTMGMDAANLSYYFKDASQEFLKFGTDKAVISGLLNARMSFNDPATFSGSIKGNGYIPNVMQGIPVLNQVGKLLGLPVDLGYIDAQVRNTLLSFTANFGKAGIRSVLIDLSKYNDWGSLITIKTEPITLGPIARKPSTSLQSVDTSFFEANATAALDRLFFHIYGLPNKPSVVVSPSGQTITSTAVDSSVIFMPALVGERESIWIVKDPAPGIWKLGVVGMSAGDSVWAWGGPRARTTTFALTSESNDRTVTMRWDGAAATDSGEVELFIDDDNAGYDGLLIGTVPERAGSFTFTLSDSLAACAYNAYAIRYDQNEFARAYSPTVHANPKLALPPASGISVVADRRTNLATVTWTPSPDPNAEMYLIRLIAPGGADTIVAGVSSIFTMAQFAIGEFDGYSISMQTVGAGGQRGCWATPVAVVAAGIDMPIATETGASTGTVFIAPNPTTSHATAFVNLPFAARVSVALYDLEGRRIATLAEGHYAAGTLRTEIDFASIGTGTYVLHVSGEGISASQRVVVQK